MAETSRNRVTITLGRSGQVVKRSVTAVDRSLGDAGLAVGAKRSVRDRLGSGGGDGHSNGSLSLFNGNSKRRREDIGASSSRAKGSDGMHIDKDDLRLKLMRKNASKQARRNGDASFEEDLRDKLKKTRQMSAIDLQRRQFEQKESRGYDLPSSTRRSEDLPRMDSHRDSYSHWESDHYRRRSPDRIPHTSRGLSPQRNVEDNQRRPLSRTFDEVRSVPYMSKDVIDTTRPMTSMAFQSTSVLPHGPLKAVLPRLSQLPQPSTIMPKSTFMVDEQLTVDGLLNSLGLGKYVVIFKAEEVDMAALKQMGENDLKELGIPMGPRKKILLALSPRSKRQA